MGVMGLWGRMRKDSIVGRIAVHSSVVKSRTCTKSGSAV